MHRRKRTVLIVVLVALGAIFVAAVVLVLMFLYEVGSAMSGDPECIPKTLPDGGLQFNNRCVNGRLIPSVPSYDASR